MVNGEMEMEMGEGYTFHSRTTGIEGILVFFFRWPSLFPFLRFLFPDTCLARMMHLIRSFDFVMWEAEGRVLTARGR